MAKNTKSPSIPSLTVGILTLNEEKRVAACIEGATFADQIVVVDAGSSDATCEIARARGAEVFVYEDWQGFAEQRNRLLGHATGDFIFFLDADEELTPELVAEIKQAVASGESWAWRVYWSEVIFGTPLPRIRNTSKGVLRLFKRDTIKRFNGLVHEQPEWIQKPLREPYFNARLKHHSRESIHASLLKLAQYAQLGAIKRRRAGKPAGVGLGILVSAVVFLRKYLFNGGILSGKKGFVYCFLLALEVFFIYAETEMDSFTGNHASKRGQ